MRVLPPCNVYADYKHFAPLCAARLQRPEPLRMPQQGNVGTCWLVAGLAGLLQLRPAELLSRITFHQDYADIRLFNDVWLRTSYVLPYDTARRTAYSMRVEAPEDLYFALLEKAVALYVHQHQSAAALQLKRRSYLHYVQGHQPHYIDLHYGTVHNALLFFSDLSSAEASRVPAWSFCRELPWNLNSCQAALQSPDEVLILTVPREGANATVCTPSSSRAKSCLHVLLVQLASLSRVQSYDPWGHIVSTPWGHGRLSVFNLRTSRGPQELRGSYDPTAPSPAIDPQVKALPVSTAWYPLEL